MNKKALIISTGGTIASVKREDGASPDETASADITAAAARLLNGRGCECGVCAAFGGAGLDSSDISPAEWTALTEQIRCASERGVKKFLITHGTDTMAYTAAWLSLTAPADSTVVITGSQRTPDSADFDGLSNISGAADALCARDGGVYIHFADKTFCGPYVHKEDSQSLCAYIPTAEEGAARAVRPIDAAELPRADSWEKISSLMEVVHIHPACLPRFAPCRILVIEGYGLGNMPQRVHKALCAAYPGDEKPIVIAASSCARGTKSPAEYGGVGIAGLTKNKFSVFNQGNYSLEFLIALSYLSLLKSPRSPGSVLGNYLDAVRAPVHAAG